MEIEICGYKVLIDDDDAGLIENHVWSCQRKKSGSVYFIRSRWHMETKKAETIFLHREIMKCKKGDGVEIDHINGNSLDCRKGNLRNATHSGNMRNRKIRSDNTTGFKGVYYRKDNGKYQARIRADNKRISLGCYSLPEQAFAAYCEASKKYHGEFGRTK